MAQLPIFFVLRSNFFDEKIKKYTTPNLIFISTSDSPIWTKKSVNQEIKKTWPYTCMVGNVIVECELFLDFNF